MGSVDFPHFLPYTIILWFLHPYMLSWIPLNQANNMFSPIQQQPNPSYQNSENLQFTHFPYWFSLQQSIWDSQEQTTSKFTFWNTPSHHHHPLFMQLGLSFHPPNQFLSPPIVCYGWPPFFQVVGIAQKVGPMFWPFMATEKCNLLGWQLSTVVIYKISWVLGGLATWYEELGTWVVPKSM